jgi:hypothetical protein
MEKAIISGSQQNARRSSQTISAIIAEYKKGQRTVKEFCSDKGINTGTFMATRMMSMMSNIPG